MYLYTVTGAVGEEGYLDLAKSGDLTGKNVYVNMTNKCPCSCVFCLRRTKQQQEGNTLWLKEGEPSVETMLELFAQYDLNVINELVFCGFGEPTERIDILLQVARYLSGDRFLKRNVSEPESASEYDRSCQPDLWKRYHPGIKGKIRYRLDFLKRTG